MLKNIIAVITAGVSLAACNSGRNGPTADGRSHIVKRPIIDFGPDGKPGPGGALGGQAGSKAATTPENARPSDRESAKPGTGATATSMARPGLGSNPPGYAALGSNFDATAARD